MVTLLAARPESANSNYGRAFSDDASEFYHYEDTGCEASDSCLDCPLPQCRYDDPGLVPAQSSPGQRLSNVAHHATGIIEL